MYSYLKCIVYDKLLKPWQSFLITLYYIFVFYENSVIKRLLCVCVEY